MLKIKTEVKCPKMAAALLLLGLKVLSGLESVREAKIDSYTRSKGTKFFSRKSGSKQLDFFSCKSERKVDFFRRCYNRQVTYFFITVYTYN